MIRARRAAFVLAPIVRAVFARAVLARAALALAVSGLAAFVSPVIAQTYPNRPITIIVPFAAGGPTDVLARVLGERIRAALGQPVLIENVTGAGGSIGVGRVVSSAPDGYTISIGHFGTHVANGADLSAQIRSPRTTSIRSCCCPAIPMDRGDAQKFPRRRPQGADRPAQGESRQSAAGTAGAGSGAAHRAACWCRR